MSMFNLTEKELKKMSVWKLDEYRHFILYDCLLTDLKNMANNK